MSSDGGGVGGLVWFGGSQIQMRICSTLIAPSPAVQAKGGYQNGDALFLLSSCLVLLHNVAKLRPQVWHYVGE